MAVLAAQDPFPDPGAAVAALAAVSIRINGRGALVIQELEAPEANGALPEGAPEIVIFMEDFNTMATQEVPQERPFNSTAIR